MGLKFDMTNIKTLVKKEKIYYIIFNGTHRASDRKVKQAGLFLGIEKLFPNCYNINNSTCQAKATAGLFFDIKNFYDINNKPPATPLQKYAHFGQVSFLFDKIFINHYIINLLLDKISFCLRNNYFHINWRNSGI
jgi:hypothetical protein